LGTAPPAEMVDDVERPQLSITIPLERPFHELKELVLAAFERAYLIRCFTQSEMNVSEASRSSGLSRKHLRTLLAKYGITRAPAPHRDREAERAREPRGRLDR